MGRRMAGSVPPLTGVEPAAKAGPLRAKDRRIMATKYLRVLSNMAVLLPGNGKNMGGNLKQSPKHFPYPRD
jgi:hypothetical protein